MPAARDAILAHLLSGSCISLCAEIHASDKCGCQTYGTVFDTPQEMSFASLSVLLSGSEQTFPDAGVQVVGKCLGLPTSVCASRLRTFAALDSRRSALITAHANRVPSVTVFDNLERLSRGSMLAIARSHGLTLDYSRATRDNLRESIILHLSTGSCIRREGLVSHLSCASLVSQFDSLGLDDPTSDPSTLLQIHILRQVCPILKLTALRRLLDLHDVTYVESDKVKKLRWRLKLFLNRLKCGKRPDGTRKERARAESDRLRAEWPQLVPEYLKRRLLDNFGLRISSERTGSFTCGSCSELCPILEKTYIRMEDFDWDLLKRPDRRAPPSSSKYGDGSETYCEADQYSGDDTGDAPTLLVEAHSVHSGYTSLDVPSSVDSSTTSGSSHTSYAVRSDPFDDASVADSFLTEAQGTVSVDEDVPMSDLDPNNPLNADRVEDDGRPSPPPPWLCPNCPEPPMPNAANTPYSDLLLDPCCIESDPETFVPVLVCCKQCRAALKGNRVPPKSVANHNYLGPVPAELADLTVVEEAMIALCRAKC
ncbi:hypothetical protein FB451DRAFT_1413364 [Mycena latifolia]|nr:hypothetical protein FB451DRAFT_1413364 [Mycena latifolia]